MKENIKLVTEVMVVIIIILLIGLGFDFLSKKVCELRGGTYISGTQNSMCRFDK